MAKSCLRSKMVVLPCGCFFIVDWLKYQPQRGNQCLQSHHDKKRHEIISQVSPIFSSCVQDAIDDLGLINQEIDKSTNFKLDLLAMVFLLSFASIVERIIPHLRSLTTRELSWTLKGYTLVAIVHFDITKLIKNVQINVTIVHFFYYFIMSSF